MADQVTTIAALPPGYGTLAGVIYAVTATSAKIWTNIAWFKMSRLPSHSNSRLFSENNYFAQATEGECVLEETGEALSRSITKRTRRFGPYRTNDFLERDVAVLHILSSYLQSRKQAETRIGDEEIAHEHFDIRHSAHSAKDIATQSEIICQVDDRILSSENSDELLVFDILLQIVEFTGIRTEVKLLKISRRDFEESVTSFKPNTEDISRIPVELIFNPNRRNITAVVLVQAAAPFDAMVIEIGYKAIEILFACAIILGSTGGAWLGLTLSSLFPQRTAAGLYMSSYGQVLPDGVVHHETSSHKPPCSWTPVGTVWTEGPEGYCILPKGAFSDEWRNIIGYWSQYTVLVLYQWFKLRLRDALEFPPYNKTRDTIRYIILVIVPFVQIMVWIVLRRQGPISVSSRRNIFAITLYLITLLATLACLILAQKTFVDTAHFYLLGKITNLTACVCCVSIMNINLGHGENLVGQQWLLIWAVGACTVVW